MKIINLTPHPLTLIPDEGDPVTIPPSGTVARAKETREDLGTVDVDGSRIPLFRLTRGDVEGLPAPSPGVGYVVSSIVASAVPTNRDDVFIVADFVRDDEGNIVGARALARV